TAVLPGSVAAPVHLKGVLSRRPSVSQRMPCPPRQPWSGPCPTSVRQRKPPFECTNALSGSVLDALVGSYAPPPVRNTVPPGRKPEMAEALKPTPTRLLPAPAGATRTRTAAASTTSVARDAP